MVVIRFPFFKMQELNLDWMMEKLKALLKFIPQNGSAGDVLQRTYDGAAWQPIAAISMDINSLQVINDVQPEDAVPVYDDSAQGNYKALISDVVALAPVQSVNGQTGNVVLNIPAVPVESVNGQTGEVVLDAADVGAMPDSYVAPVTSVNGQTGDVVTGGVTSVNGQTGAVVLDADDVGAMPDSYVAPVTSVNGQTGDVVVSGSGGLTKTLLWANPDSSVQFTAQTVVVDLSSYSLVMIEFLLYGTLMTAVFANIPTAAGNSIANSAMYGQRFVGRNFTVSASGVTFDSGFYVSTYDGAVITADTYMTPVAVYGIK